MIIRYNIKITGQVQGVGFRYSARNIARKYNIRGIVRNEPDGSVYIEAEGRKEDMDHFLYWCHRGPGAGRVDHVVFHEAPLRNFDGFNVTYF